MREKPEKGKSFNRHQKWANSNIPFHREAQRLKKKKGKDTQGNRKMGGKKLRK